MNKNMLFACMRGGVLVVIIACSLAGCGKAPTQTSPATQKGLDAAIKVRTETFMLQQNVASTVQQQLEAEAKGTKFATAIRKVVAKANAKQEEGNILLDKDRYVDAIAAYNEAATLYRQTLDWRKVEKVVSLSENRVAIARLVVEALAKTNQVAIGEQLQINAEGYLEAGEIEKAILEYSKAQNAIESLIPSEGTVTFEQVIAGRSAMIAARNQIKNLSKYIPVEGKVLGPDTLADIIGRALKAESAAAVALEGRYDPFAHILFGVAEKYFKQAAAIENVQTERQSVEDAMRQTGAAFKDGSRTIAFERGKQALTDADKALAVGDLETAKTQLSLAAEQLTIARAEAQQQSELTEARKSWTDALTAVDEPLLSKYVKVQYHDAKAKASDAQSKADVGQAAIALGLFKEATTSLNAAIAIAQSQENLVKAREVIAKLECAISKRQKSDAETLLAELENLTPKDTRLIGYRTKISTFPDSNRPIKSSKDLIAVPHEGIAGINRGSSKDDVERIFGKPDTTRYEGRVLGYTRLGIDFTLTDGEVHEVHLNVGYKGHTAEGVKLGGSKAQVFAAYGTPLKTVDEDLHTGSNRSEDRILLHQNNSERIYYQKLKMAIWFRDGKVIQICLGL